MMNSLVLPSVSNGSYDVTGIFIVHWDRKSVMTSLAFVIFLEIKCHVGSDVIGTILLLIQFVRYDVTGLVFSLEV